MPNENNQKTFTQAEVDAAIKSALSREKKQREKYVPREEVEAAIEAAKAEAVAEFEAQAIHYTDTLEQFKAAGGHEAAFDDFYDLHGENIRNDNVDTIKADIMAAKEKASYMFGEAPAGDRSDHGEQTNTETNKDAPKFAEGTLQQVA